MGCIGSKNKKIDGLYFKPFPSCALKNVDKIVCIGSNVFATSKRDPRMIYTTSRLSGKGYWSGTTLRNCTELKALVKLGVVTLDEVKEHGAKAELKESLSERVHLLRATLVGLKTLGIKPESKQLKDLASAMASVSKLESEMATWDTEALKTAGLALNDLTRM